MLAFQVGIVGYDAKQLAAGVQRVRPALVGAMTEVMLDVWRIATKKVSGDVLHVRTGHLRDSLGPPSVQEVQGGVAGQLGARVKYAAIHEFGGVIPAHTVYAKHASALRWIGPDGRARFAKSVRIPAITMPKRPFLQPAFDEEMPAARLRFVQAFEGAFNSGSPRPN
jgi:phage gpG-like protein